MSAASMTAGVEDGSGEASLGGSGSGSATSLAASAPPSSVDMDASDVTFVSASLALSSTGCVSVVGSVVAVSDSLRVSCCASTVDSAAFAG